MKKWYVGNVGQVKEVQTVGDNEVLNFGLAIQTGWGDHKKTLWLNCALWNRSGAYPYIKTGMPLAVDGELQPNDFGNPPTYTTEDGEARASYRFRVSDFLFIGKAESTDDAQPEEEEDDIPF